MSINLLDERTPPPPRSIWEELEAWSKDFAPWQRLLLAAAVRFGKIPSPTIEEAYALFLAQYALAPEPSSSPEIPESVTGRALRTGGRGRLRRIHSPSGINQLPYASEITFTDGMTVIYGGNAVGRVASRVSYRTRVSADNSIQSTRTSSTTPRPFSPRRASMWSTRPAW